MDKRVLEECKLQGWIDGAACVAAWIVGDTVVLANIGKSPSYVYSYCAVWE